MIPPDLKIFQDPDFKILLSCHRFEFPLQRRATRIAISVDKTMAADPSSLPTNYDEMKFWNADESPPETGVHDP